MALVTALLALPANGVSPTGTLTNTTGVIRLSVSTTVPGSWQLVKQISDSDGWTVTYEVDDWHQNAMNITEKLGLAADATPEQIADALNDSLVITVEVAEHHQGELTGHYVCQGSLEAVTEESKRLASRVEELEKALGEKTKARR